MSKSAWAFVYLILIAGAIASIWALAIFRFPIEQAFAFLALTALATIAQLSRVDAISHQSYYSTFIFIFAGLLLLVPSLFVLLVIISYCAEWAKERWIKSGTLRQWYLQPFNISTIILGGLAAYWLWAWLGALSDLFMTAGSALAVVLGACTFVVVNHAVTGQAIVLARGKSWRELGVLDRENLILDLVLLLMGYTFAFMWHVNGWLVPVALAPLVLIYRALLIPALQKEAQTDDKTGLWNPRHFARLYTAEFDRARRFQRPLSVLMADLDFLRNVNNTYGHLAGDEVLGQIGRLISGSIREYDIAGRFGGEEFCIALPEAGLNEARAMAERLRLCVDNHPFRVRTSPIPIHVTMSIGIATHPADAQTATDLIHDADVAVYQAKQKGRNCTVAFPEVPSSVRVGHVEGDHASSGLPASPYEQAADYRAGR